MRLSAHARGKSANWTANDRGTTSSSGVANRTAHTQPACILIHTPLAWSLMYRWARSCPRGTLRTKEIARHWYVHPGCSFMALADSFEVTSSLQAR
ncbi:hypothetical protein ACFPRL_34630 [Pseudoclavibacter helvolus]